MKNYPIQNWIRVLLGVCGLMLIAVLFVPMWRIDLDAPQYPEGLQMLIFSNKLGGNVDIINGLNHYIGMKTLHTEDFIEFTILPYLIIFFALFFIITAIVRKRKWMITLLFSFIIFGILAMIDFWKWEYNYGHNLNPEAAIIVPGMAYQPPLIGFKQLLNFGAYSVPDMGGWIFIAAGAILLICTLFDFMKNRKFSKMNKMMSAGLTGILLLFITSCSPAQEPIKLGYDNCKSCKMTISDAKYGVELITLKGKVYKFDEVNCLLSFMKEGSLKKEDIKEIFFTDFCSPHQLTNQKTSFLLKSNQLKSPMGGNIATFSNNDSLKFYTAKWNGETILWNQLFN